MRLANVYGPRQFKGGEAGVVSIFVDSAVSGEPCVLNGDGRQTRDFVYVGDVVDALIKTLTVKFCGELNISTARETNLLEVIAAIEKARGGKLDYNQMPAKDGEQRRSCLSYQKAHQMLGFVPQVDLEEGISLTLKWAKLRS